MKKYIHIPGPWRIVKPTNPDFVAKQGNPVGPAICSVEKAFTVICIHAEPSGKPCPNVDELDAMGEANARLICAAPELLEACKMIAKWLHSEELAPNRLEVVLNAIEKATGEVRIFPVNPEPDYDNQAQDYEEDTRFAEQPTPYEP